MISTLNSSSLSNGYINNPKDLQKNGISTTVGNSKISGNKIEKLKTDIESGAYKIDLSALASKMADNLI